MNDFSAAATELLKRQDVRILAVVVGSVVAAWLANAIIVRVLMRFIRRTRTDLDDRIMARLHRPIFLSLILFGLHLAVGILAPGQPWDWLAAGVIQSIAILLWAVAVAQVVHVLLDGLSKGGARRRWVEARTVPLFDNVAKLVILGGVVYALLSAWELDVRPWLASAGIAGLALGFAAKDTLANLFGGLFIIADAPYKIGDFIILDSGERGQVTQIGLRSSRLLTRDDVEITLPNAHIANAKIVNESGGPSEKNRVSIRVGVAYGSDVDKVRRVLLQVARQVEGVAVDPEPRVRFDAFGDSALDFRLLCWVEQPAQRGICLDALNTAVYKAFMAEQIVIPFPQRDIHIKDAPRP